MRAPSLIAWHYTTWKPYVSILSDDNILPGKALTCWGGHQAVWFSMDQEWEVTANRTIVDPNQTMIFMGKPMPKIVRPSTREEMITMGGGLYRFGVTPETAPHTWQSFLLESRMDPIAAAEVERGARYVCSNMSDYCACVGPVPSDKWQAVEQWHVGEKAWTPATPPTWKARAS